MRKIISSIKTYLRIILVVKSWVRFNLFSAGLLSETLIKFRNGYEFSLNKGSFNNFMDYVHLFRIIPDARIENTMVKFPFRGKELKFEFGKFGPNIVSEVFGQDVYGKLLGGFGIRGKDVVDIGAANGDTPVYFALLGAKKVYAYEPSPSYYLSAKENIRLNGLGGVCEIINGGVGAKSGFFIENDHNESLFGGHYKELRDNPRIPVISLTDMVRKFELNNAVIKSDCEGYEYEIFLPASRETLRHFDLIIMEYHYGPERLEKKLRDCGFSVTVLPTGNLFAPERGEEHRNMSLGYLKAVKT